MILIDFYSTSIVIVLARIGSGFGALELIWNNSKILINFTRIFQVSASLSIRFPTGISLVRRTALTDGRLLSFIVISRSHDGKTFTLM